MTKTYYDYVMFYIFNIFLHVAFYV